jgi:hypothetical protein
LHKRVKVRIKKTSRPQRREAMEMSFFKAGVDGQVRNFGGK